MTQKIGLEGKNFRAGRGLLQYLLHPQKCKTCRNWHFRLPCFLGLKTGRVTRFWTQKTGQKVRFFFRSGYPPGPGFRVENDVKKWPQKTIFWVDFLSIFGVDFFQNFHFFFTFFKTQFLLQKKIGLVVFFFYLFRSAVLFGIQRRSGIIKWKKDPPFYDKIKILRW